LLASNLHPEVWSAARRPWDAGLHREAVGNAATAVETMAKVKTKFGLASGAKLWGELFSLNDPTPDRPRLRLPVDPAMSDRWKSAHVGAADFGRGCMEGIRNWAAHSIDEADEQAALEYLAALSVLARWVESATVARTP
jgi:hypothetical protein